MDRVRVTGRVESLNKKVPDAPRPTFGFIVSDAGDSYFFVPSGMEMTSPVTFDQLREGMPVEFTVIPHPKGPRAIEVRAEKL